MVEKIFEGEAVLPKGISFYRPEKPEAKTADLPNS